MTDAQNYAERLDCDPRRAEIIGEVLGRIEIELQRGHWESGVAAWQYAFRRLTGLDERPLKLRDVPLAEMDIDVKVVNALERIEVMTLGELLAREGEIETLPYWGERMRSDLWRGIVKWLMAA